IELGEIEAALLAQPGVRQAAAWVVGESPALAAAVAGADPAALASALALLLPDHMVPTRWLTLDALPLTANGKVDRRALAAMPPVSAPAAGEPPRPGIEQDMAAIWRDMLRLDAVSRDDGFFVLGGDSLLATKLIARLDAEGWRAPQPLRQLFIRPRLADFCTIWQRGANQKSETSLSPEPDRLHQPFPLTEVQAAYWMGQSEGLPQHCGTGYLIEFDGAGLDLTRLEQAWRLLWRRHPMLSAVVSSDGQQSIPRAEPDTAIIRHAAAADLAAARAAIAAVWQERSSARAGQPHAAHAVPYAGGRCRIGVFFDYLTLDGYSIKLLLAQWKQAFQDPASLPPAPRLAFRDFVVQRRPDAEATAEAEQYWRQRLDALPPAPALPMARETTAPSRSRFVRLSARLDAARWGRFRESARRHGLTASSSLLTAYACILARWSGGAAHSLNLTLFDRPAAHPDIPGLVGDFTTLAPVAFLPDAAASFLELARRSQRETADALQYRAVSSIWVQREKARQTGRQAAALPVVFTSTLGLADDFLDGAPPGFPALADGGLSETPQVWLDHQLYESRGELILAWDLVDGLFPAGMMDAMFSAYVELLERLADQPDSWLHPTAPALPQTQRAVRDAVNASGKPLPPRALHGPVFEQTRLRPDAVALIDAASGQSIRFGELALRARRVAALLLRHGLAPGEAVAVTLPR
ncbi:condensation domain-containing protein, partial [Chromobacterium vaccinii]|uniref:condensation domain-containing protein n=1 Tax=Chromobacterium vaccinii TaxID=1108595 RepID=UPI003C76AD66